jgi:hypothetical protein
LASPQGKAFPKHTAKGEAAVADEKIISIDQWRKTHRDYKSGDPRRGTAKLVYWDDRTGTVLGPVVVLDANGKRMGPKESK